MTDVVQEPEPTQPAAPEQAPSEPPGAAEEAPAVPETTAEPSLPQELAEAVAGQVASGHITPHNAVAAAAQIGDTWSHSIDAVLAFIRKEFDRLRGA